MSAPIHFHGTDYDSLESMPPNIRAAYEQSQRDKAQRQDDEAEKGDAGDAAGQPATGSSAWWQALGAHVGAAGAPDPQSFKPAWGGAQPAGGVPVPAAFEPVTSLGPAAAVHERDSGDILNFPTFGPPRPQVVVRYRDGFAFRAGHDLHTWRWEEVALIQSNLSSQRISTGFYTSHEYMLAQLNGQQVILDDRLNQVGALAEQIKKPVFARLWPPLAQRYQSGQALTFGPVTVDRQHGPQLDGKPFAWDAIQNVQVARGQFKIELKDGKHHALRASKIPNIELLCQLIGLNLNSAELAYD